jgi:hypothetical protein
VELARAYLVAKVAFEAADRLKATAIADLCGLCNSMQFVAETPGGLRCVHLTKGSGRFGAYWTDVFRFVWGVRDMPSRGLF